MSDWKFKLGDWVKCNDNLVCTGVYKAKRYRVVERTAAECPGGVQRQYKVRDYDNILAQVGTMHEFELLAWTDEDTGRLVRTQLKDWVEDLPSIRLIEFGATIEAEMKRRADEAAKKE